MLQMVQGRPELTAQSISVDQSMNICLNRGDHLQVRIGQPDDLPNKLAVASSTLLAAGDHAADRIAYLDVTSPGQPAVMPRADADKGDHDGNGRGVDR